MGQYYFAFIYEGLSDRALLIQPIGTTVISLLFKYRKLLQISIKKH